MIRTYIHTISLYHEVIREQGKNIQTSFRKVSLACERVSTIFFFSFLRHSDLCMCMQANTVPDMIHVGACRLTRFLSPSRSISTVNNLLGETCEFAVYRIHSATKLLHGCRSPHLAPFTSGYNLFPSLIPVSAHSAPMTSVRQQEV